MFITVKYGANESLILNPYCAVVNLLTNIKLRAGYGDANVTLDLSDETGEVKDLDLHKYDDANKYLTSHTTYILVEKQMVYPDKPDSPEDGSSSPHPPQYNFIPLLEKIEDIFPNYKVQVAHFEKKKKPPKRNVGSACSKSPSPAGRKTKKRMTGKKTTK